MNTTTEIKLGSVIRFRDGGRLECGTVCTLANHPFAYGEYKVSVARYQGLVSVRPENIVDAR